ncbi:MAG: hypothetical protein ABI624_19450 [Casimicrobiaceae bacterium]
MRILALLFVYAGSVAAQAITPVSPPTDWTGMGIVMAFGVIVFGLVAYIIYIKRTPGYQMGEEELEVIATKLHMKLHPPTATSTAIEYNGLTFVDQAAVDEYKKALAVVAAATP